jgi:threonine dehydrogenase-like Zn-dependent dehydrogenase
MKALYFDSDMKRIVLTKALGLVWPGAPLSRVSPVRYARIEEPLLPGPNWVKVKNRMCGLCGSDVHFMFLEIDPKVAPAAVPPIGRKFLGHELVGEVVESGPGAREFAAGDRVILRIDWPSCYQKEARPMCSQCARGNYLLCESPGFPNAPKNQGGGFSPVMVAHKTQLVKIDDSIPDRDAILIEPAACCVRAALKRPPQKGEKVLVVGAGTIGLMMIAVLKAIAPGALVWVVARHAHQQAIARRLGAAGVISGRDAYKQVAEATGGRYYRGMFSNEMVIGGFDVIYDTVGNDRSVNDALRWAGAEGTVVVVGIEFAPKSLDYSPVWYQEVRLTGINCHGQETFRGKSMTSFDAALVLYREGKLDFSGFLTHTFPMDDFKSAVKVFFDKKRHQAVKVALVHPA